MRQMAVRSCDRIFGRLIVISICLTFTQAVTVNLSEEEKAAFVSKHNELRRLPGAADMEKLIWSSMLAEMAQEWADKCQGVTKGNPEGYPLRWDNIGQNIYWSCSTTKLVDLTRAVQVWYDEVSNYNYIFNECASSKVCDHYTQVVWAKTTEVGCAWTDCGAAGQLIICNYGPGGNNIREPYQKGDPCHKCSRETFWCNENLCDSNCLQPSDGCECKGLCQNCATKNPDTCSCTCADGWFGPDCSVPCLDHHVYCGNSWPRDLCTPSNGYVWNNCLAMCSRCVSVDTPQTCLPAAETCRNEP